MKFAEISGKITLIALAACCLLDAPAFCMPMDGGPGGREQWVMFPSMNNTTACLATETGRGCSRWETNGNESLGMKGRGMGEMGMRPAMLGHDDNRGRFDRTSRHGMRGAFPIMLLVDDLTVEDLGNMTVNQIRDLSDKKMAELDNMTLAEIKLFQDKKVQERDNMTLNQLLEENKNMRQISRILDGLGFGRHVRA